MNERIRELARQTDIIDVELLNDSQSKMLEKFAELIVRECIELNRQELSFSAFARMLDKYSEHFGVE